MILTMIRARTITDANIYYIFTFFFLHVYFVVGTMRSASYTLSPLNLKKKKKKPKQKPLRSNCYSQTCFTDKKQVCGNR